jgi:hypothetical protein
MVNSKRAANLAAIGGMAKHQNMQINGGNLKFLIGQSFFSTQTSKMNVTTWLFKHYYDLLGIFY